MGGQLSATAYSAGTSRRDRLTARMSAGCAEGRRGGGTLHSGRGGGGRAAASGSVWQPRERGARCTPGCGGLRCCRRHLRARAGRHLLVRPPVFCSNLPMGLHCHPTHRPWCRVIYWLWHTKARWICSAGSCCVRFASLVSSINIPNSTPSCPWASRAVPTRAGSYAIRVTVGGQNVPGWPQPLHVEAGLSDAAQCWLTGPPLQVGRTLTGRLGARTNAAAWRSLHCRPLTSKMRSCSTTLLNVCRRWQLVLCRPTSPCIAPLPAWHGFRCLALLPAGRHLRHDSRGDAAHRRCVRQCAHGGRGGGVGLAHAQGRSPRHALPRQRQRQRHLCPAVRRSCRACFVITAVQLPCALPPFSQLPSWMRGVQQYCMMAPSASAEKLSTSRCPTRFGVSSLAGSRCRRRATTYCMRWSAARLCAAPPTLSRCPSRPSLDSQPTSRPPVGPQQDVKAALFRRMGTLLMKCCEIDTAKVLHTTRMAQADIFLYRCSLGMRSVCNAQKSVSVLSGGLWAADGNAVPRSHHRQRRAKCRWPHHCRLWRVTGAHCRGASIVSQFLKLFSV